MSGVRKDAPIHGTFCGTPVFQGCDNFMINKWQFLFMKKKFISLFLEFMSFILLIQCYCLEQVSTFKAIEISWKCIEILVIE